MLTSPTNEEVRDALIKAEIERLQRTGSDQWQRLQAQIAANPRIIQLNLPQLVLLETITKRKEVYGVCGRGMGKTTAIAKHVKSLAINLPRGTGVFVAPSYRKLLGQILPSLRLGLELMGLHENVHYFIQRKPPARWKWPSPYQPPARYDRFIQFWTGFGLHLISHDVSDDGRGLNIDAEVGDESALLRSDYIEANTRPGLRGSMKSAFQGNPYFVTAFHVSSMPLTLKGEWLLAKEQAANERPEEVGFIMADCRYNLHNLADGYLEKAERTAGARWLFLAEYMNVRPNRVEAQFYADLNEDKHTYTSTDHAHYHQVGQVEDHRADGDLTRNAGLMLGVDWGVNINCAVTCQKADVHGRKELRALKEVHALGRNNEDQDDLADKWCNYYEDYSLKEVSIYYDQTGNIRTGVSKLTRAQQFSNKLRARGWKVQLMTSGEVNPPHGAKHTLWGLILRENSGIRGLPVFRLNKDNCPNLWVSMTHAPAVKSSTSGTIQKDKASERRKSIDEVHATHYSDAIDTIVWGMYSDVLRFGQVGSRFIPG